MELLKQKQQQLRIMFKHLFSRLARHILWKMQNMMLE